MNGIKNKFIFFLFLSFTLNIIGQTKVDTISINDKKVIIEYPIPSTVRWQNYEEGSFMLICCSKDTALITVHYGSMVGLPLVNQKNKVVQSLYSIEGDIKITRGFVRKENELKKFYREDNLNKVGFNIVYENVPEEKVAEYERYFNNIKIIKAQQ